MKHTQGRKCGLAWTARAVLAGLMLITANGAKGAEKMATADFHVAVSGKDTNPGTVAVPFAAPANGISAAAKTVRDKINLKASDGCSHIYGFNYQPSWGSNGVTVWGEKFDPKKYREELASGKKYFPKMNAVRIWLSWSSYRADPARFVRQFQQAVEICGELDLLVVPVMFNRWVGNPVWDVVADPEMAADFDATFVPYIRDVVGPLKGDGRILAWDLCNEPPLRGGELQWLGNIQKAVKKIDPDAWTCIGTVTVEQTKTCAPYQDILTPHLYFGGYPDFGEYPGCEYAKYVQLAKDVAKPLISTECCWGSLDDGVRVKRIRDELGALKKYKIGFFPHALYESYVADLHRPQYGFVDKPGYMAFINMDGTLRSGHDVYNAFTDMLTAGISIGADRVVFVEEEVVMEVMESQPLTAQQLFCQAGTDREETFAAVRAEHRFEVVNSSTSHLMVAFGGCTEATVTPGVVRLAPGGRQAVTLKARADAKTFALSYALTMAATPFTTHSNRYRAYSDGETVLCVPVAPAHYAAMKARTKAILKDSLEKVSDPAMPAGAVIYTPGPFYKQAGIFARDFLYQLEGAGRYTATAEETKRAVDFLALKQLTENRKVGAFTYPKGAIPDHVYPDGRWCWGPGNFSGDDTAHFRRPSMDEAMCFVTLAWHYGYKAGWDAAWQAWFKQKAQRFSDAWNSVPRNPKSGLVTQWSTPDHIGANGIDETNGACVMWGFHDSYGFGGDDVGVSVLACNAARALSDMHEHAGDATAVKIWSGIADAMRDAVRAQFHKDGYLPWGVGTNAPTMASPDFTGYAVWSGILTDAQADAASDWFAARYRADKAAGGAADLFHMSAPFRGAVRMARKADDVSPGRHVWPDMRDGNHWENLTYGYNAYQDGGYWYYMSLGVAATLNRKHPDLAREWVGNAYADLAGADANPPYERIDGMKPENNRYNASVGPLMGMGMPAVVSSVNIVVGEK